LQKDYLRVNPDNRLVADSLEADWSHKLRALTEAQEEYERRSEEDRKIFNEEERAAILQLATYFPRLWRDVNTPAANANGWFDCCWRMSLCCVVSRSRCTCVSAGEPARL